MSKLIKDLPMWVHEIVFERQKEQGNEPSAELYLYNLQEDGNFTWEHTKEGEIWENADDGNYQPLADFHGIAIDENGEKVGEVDLIKAENNYLEFTNKLFHQTTPTTKDPVDGYGGC